MWYNVYCAISKYPNMYCTAQFATEGWSGRDMSNVIVKENESLDSALRRRKSLKQLENVSSTNIK